MVRDCWWFLSASRGSRLATRTWPSAGVRCRGQGRTLRLGSRLLYPKANSAHTEGPAGSTTSGWCTRSAWPTRECLLHRVSQPVISSHTRSGSSSCGRASASQADEPGSNPGCRSNKDATPAGSTPAASRVRRGLALRRLSSKPRPRTKRLLSGQSLRNTRQGLSPTLITPSSAHLHCTERSCPGSPDSRPARSPWRSMLRIHPRLSVVRSMTLPRSFEHRDPKVRLIASTQRCTATCTHSAMRST